MSKRIVIEWTRVSVRLAFAEGQGRTCQLRSLRHAALAADGTIPEKLRGFLDGQKSAGAEVIAVIPREQVITRVVKFPTESDAELASMVELYAKAQLPYPREQTVVDFQVLDRREGFSSVAVVACQREVVDRHVAMLQEAGLPAQVVTMSASGVLAWWRLARAAAAPAGAPCLIIHVDDARTDFVLVGEDRLLFARSLAQGVSDWSLAGEAIELLLAEIDRSRTAARKELPGTEIRAVVLTGVASVLSWAPDLGQRLGMPVLAVAPHEAFGAGPAVQSAEISPVVTGGIACGGTDGLLNLTPPEQRGQMEHLRQVRELTLVSALGLGALVLAAAVLGANVSRHLRQASRVERLIAQLEPEARKVKEQSRAVQLVETVLEDRKRLAAGLSGVFGVTPGGVGLESVNLDRVKRELSVRGNAESTQAVLDYVEHLRTLDGVEDVRLKYSTRRVTPSGERTDFELLLRQKARAQAS